jgi:hypothetical protein
MIRRTSRRFAATLALTGWIGFAGGGESAKILAQAFGFHGDCRMPCCREQANAACPRMRAAANDPPEGGHAHHSAPAVAADETTVPSSPLSFSSSRSGCEERCALLSSSLRSALSAASIVTSSPSTTGRTYPGVTAERPSTRFLRDVPSRAPPA